MQTIFPEGTQPSWKITKIPGDGGGGGVWKAPFGMEIPGGGGAKAKALSVWGMDFYWNYTIYVKCEEHRLRKSYVS